MKQDWYISIPIGINPIGINQSGQRGVKREKVVGDVRNEQS